MSARSADFKRLLLGPASLLLRLVHRLLALTYRYEVLHPERLEALLENGKPVVLTLWHNQTFAVARFLHSRIHQTGFDVTVFTSQSRDGQLVVNFTRPWKMNTVRGSTSRGGHAAMRALHRAIVKQGSSPLMTPDGPRGPRYVNKVGGVLLARLAKVPIQPLGVAAQRSWVLDSWDAMFVPKPFSRIGISFGELQEIPSELDESGQESERLKLEGTLCDLMQEAADAVSGS